MKIAVEGIMGAGKTSVSKELAQQLNAYHFDCDKVVKMLYKENQNLINEINVFMDRQSLEIDLIKIKELLFVDDEFKQKLQGLVYSYLEDEIDKIESEIIIIDGINSFSLNLDYDLKFVITADKADIINRVMKRDGRTEEEIEMIIKKQVKDYLLTSRTYFFNTSNIQMSEILISINKLIRGHNASENWKDS